MTTTAVLDVLTTEPYNAQASREALREDRTPAAACFVHSHFAVPRIATGRWRLRLPGPAGLTYPELLAWPSKAVDVVPECAGNGRSEMAPCPPGLAWGDRAVSCVRFHGAPVRLVVPATAPATSGPTGRSTGRHANAGGTGCWRERTTRPVRRSR